MPICICRRASRVLIPRKDKRAGPRKGGEEEEGTRRGTVGRTARKVRGRGGEKDSDAYAIGRVGRGDVLIGIGDD